MKLYKLPISEAPKAGKEEALWLIRNGMGLATFPRAATILPRNFSRVLRCPSVHVLCILGFSMFLPGCLESHDRTSRSDLPPSWLVALQSPNPTPSVSGNYLDRGEYTHEFSGHPNHIDRGRLARLLFPEIKPPVAAEQVQLIQHGQDRLEIVALVGGRVIASKTEPIKIDRTTGALSLPKVHELDAGGNLAAAADQSKSIVLYKGRDGNLYAQLKSFTIGVVAAVVPMKASNENWGRWTIAP